MSLNSTLDIGVAALGASAYGLQVAGQNIANVNTPGYVREQLLLSTAPPELVGELVLGRGVQVDGVVQVIDRFLAARVRDASSDPDDIEGIWRKLYIGTAMNGRRGVVVHTMGAIDMALWDLKGKARGLPLYKLLGEQRPDPVVPYASLQPAGDSFEAYRDALCESAEPIRNSPGGMRTSVIPTEFFNSTVVPR